MILTPPQILAVAMQAGFPRTVAVSMVAIALRESGGDAEAFNGDSATGDLSYGLWQINLLGTPLARFQQLGLAAPTPAALFDPLTNAKAAFILWAGNNANLRVAWYIDKAGYQERYEAHLPEAQRAGLGFQ